MISDSKLLASAAWDAQSLNELKAKAGEDPAANIRPVARQVEGMFVQMMLKSMRDALPKDGLFSSEHTHHWQYHTEQDVRWCRPHHRLMHTLSFFNCSAKVKIILSHTVNTWGHNNNAGKAGSL